MPTLTRREAELLAILEATDDELVYERGTAYLGLRPVGARTVNNLVRKMCISLSQDGVLGGFERYTINETGKHFLREYWGLLPQGGQDA